MRKLIKTIIEELKMYRILSINYGHFKTRLNWSSIDRCGNFIPWYTYPAIEFLGQFDFTTKSIFEYGSGNSSFFWAKISKLTISIEDDIKWFNKISKNTFDNLIIKYVNSKVDYTNSISKFNQKFDVIIIDALYREDCVMNSINFLKKGGMIILDDSDRYSSACNYLRKKGFIQIDFIGFSPIVPYTKNTTIFFKSLDFKRLKKSILSLGIDRKY